MVKTKRGPSKLDLLALGGLLTLAVVLILPRLLGLRMDHNEQDAIHALRQLRREIVDLRRDRDQGYSRAAAIPLAQLIAPRADGRTILEDCELRESLKGERLLRHGYLIRVDYGFGEGEGLEPKDFTIFAWPQRYGETGAKMFAMNEDGALFRSRNLARQLGSDREPSGWAALSSARGAEPELERKGIPTEAQKDAWELLEPAPSEP